MIAPISLRAFAGQYALEHGLVTSSANVILYAIASFERSLDRTASLNDLFHELVNDWLGDLLAGQLDRSTIHTYRRILLVVWRAAAEGGLIPAPCRVRKVRVPTKLPRAWTLPELRRLLEFAAKSRRPDYWRAFILVGYETGLRLSDLLALNADQLRDCMVVTAQRKTGEVVACQLSADALVAFSKVRRFDTLRIRRLQEKFGDLLLAAKLPGSIKWLRRSGATHCERERPGSAKDYLGHKTHGLAEKHYIDQAQLGISKPRPPAIE